MILYFIVYICYTSVKMLKMKLSNQQSLGASNFYLNRKTAIVLVMEHLCLGGSACCLCMFHQLEELVLSVTWTLWPVSLFFPMALIAI